jgi:carbonic anhydrase
LQKKPINITQRVSAQDEVKIQNKFNSTTSLFLFKQQKVKKSIENLNSKMVDKNNSISVIIPHPDTVSLNP